MVAIIIGGIRLLIVTDIVLVSNLVNGNYKAHFL